MKIESGDRCVVIGEEKGFEENIGVILTATQQCACGHWRFTDADRGVLILIHARWGFPISYIRSSDEVVGNCIVYPSKWLVPIKGDHPYEEDELKAPSQKAPA